MDKKNMNFLHSFSSFDDLNTVLEFPRSILVAQ